ncbi:FG-GAP repeat domain-containing protein [Rhodopirellula bahusiensis]|uniref:VCBS repeat-containing protein n=1 Tax=Rhodopirellula bahusiensis TaxID=2014065 RepID=A0A2G1W277_9BACT|nr:VCBS repeat-containing protein [Rhodopirellula bahusiensis]PHQ32779.1 hypothetical protein CEE69_23620 [Rhodopirellula bahusiensis]
MRPSSQKSSQSFHFFLAAALSTAAAFGLVGCNSGSSVNPELIERLIASQADSRPTDAESIRAFCGDCHDSPDPGIFEWDHWEEEVDQGFRLYRESLRDDLVPPDRDATLAYYRDTSPEKWDMPIPERSMDIRFERHVIDWPRNPAISAVSSLLRLPDRVGNPTIALTDMWTGTVAQFSAEQPRIDQINVDLLASVAHASRVAESDLDGDGITDFLVADLGTHNPQTEHEGNVWWLRLHTTGHLASEYERIPLRLAMSRVADARPIDFDSDGDQDILVGDFGLHFEGGLHLGLNQGVDAETGVPQFEWRTLDERPGIITIEVLDFDGDGEEDFLTLLTQHYEAIQFHRNLGDGTYETIVLHQASNPAYGSSSMQIVDFDQDGDWDVLATNGDTFDDSLAKPYHGVWWLENEGSYPLKRHDVGTMPGCYHASAADFDHDGDLDIAATSWLGNQEIARYPADSFDGLVWFENEGNTSEDSTFNFQRHTLEMNRCQAATLEVVDWNGDGYDDLLVPQSVMAFGAVQPLVVWINQGDAARGPSN